MADRTSGAAGIHALGSQYDNALSCIRCALCLSVCPTYQLTLAEEESPRGRIALARALAEGALDITPDFVRHQQNCLLCEACTAICPAGVKMEPLGVAVRRTIAERATPRWRRALRRSVMNATLGDMPRFRRLCRLARLYQRSGVRRALRRSGVLRWLRLEGLEALLPAMPRRFLVPRGQQWRPQGGGRRRAALFAGCIMSTAFAGTTAATARTLARRGYEVTATAGQGCCGALHLHAGEVDDARRLARVNLAAIDPERYDAIVTNAAGCGSTLKGYGRLLADDPDPEIRTRAAAFAARVRDITEELDGCPVQPPLAPLPLSVTYQEPCHLAHAQRITRQPRRLLQRIPGLVFREMAEPSLCCGSAGIYNVTHAGIAGRLRDRKLDHALETGATVIATANPGCLLHLRAGVEARGLGIEVRHLIDLVDAAERDRGCWERDHAPQS